MPGGARRRRRAAAGGWRRVDRAGPDRGASAEARELRSAQSELEDAQAELDSLQTEFEQAGDAAARQRVRAQAWRRRAVRAERRNRALRQALAQARQE